MEDTEETQRRTKSYRKGTQRSRATTKPKNKNHHGGTEKIKTFLPLIFADQR